MNHPFLYTLKKLRYTHFLIDQGAQQTTVSFCHHDDVTFTEPVARTCRLRRLV